MTFTTDVQEDPDLRPYPETSLPDHTQLPESDGTFVKNWQEHPQTILLTDSIKPVLQKLYPDSQYFIGQDLGIYWRITEPPEKGAEAPDWFYVPNVPPTLNGKTRRSYVLWQEYISPLIALEFVSGNGSEERDKTPWKGKLWIYEQVIKPAFYGIYEVNKASIEVYELIGGKYQLLAANERGHYSITPMGVELGLWQGEYQNAELPWLRWWDLQGNLLLTGEERANRLAAQLRALGIEPEA
ncbi:Uma2 family endonuclease [Dolichospermum sp. UHCC 0684]|jgi:Uma2 family endonuclease|uniref:Uma2 family endonuclease n=1 Tax=unclassified Dolichospermum TaxID=2622029 RepID=UPI001444D078|nr:MULTISPECIES: Uma2 family endonuclease [unclassified Dolichospermum]MEA5531252.1 Uma2 family endonuclease [Dolichospermum sp. UHCC 0684]MTJ34425.1 Uma2 family endonuclease [Dolichospermum sp. UHCC 0260]